MGKPLVLDLPPGYLNDFNVDDIDQESIDSDSETPQSIINRIKDKVFSPNKFKTSGTLIGVLLKVNNKYTDLDCTAQDGAIALAEPRGGSKRYGLNTYKVYIPELHFMLKKPSKITGNLTAADKLAIDAFPDIQAIDTLVQRQGAQPGDLVKVELANKGAITRMYFAGPLDPKDTGYIAQELKDCIDACRKTYTGQGASGDCKGKNKKVHALDSALPLNTDAGHAEKKLIDDGASSWLGPLVDPAKNSNFEGIVWIGKLEGNGPKDNEKMIDGEGRNTLIYMPVGVRPTNHLEVIYFFHDVGKFANDASEWNEIGKTITQMTKPNPQLDNARRNLVFVMAEMPWSKENNGTVKPRADSKLDSLTGYGDRQQMVWGWDGKNVFDRHPLFAEINSATDRRVYGNISKFIGNIEKVLSEKLSVDKKMLKHITLVGDRRGSIAISNLARMKLLKKFGKNLKSIKLWNGDYSSTDTNKHHDNDIKDIIIAVDPNKVEVEFHLSKDAPAITKKAVAAYIGQTSAMTSKWNGVPPAKENNPLIYARNELQIFYANALKYKKSGETAGPDIKPEDEDMFTQTLEEKTKNGESFVNGNSSKTLRLSGRWVNFIFRGVESSVNFDWVSWLEEPNTPTAAAATQVGKTPGKVIKVADKSGDIVKSDESRFEDFKGRTMLYNSAETKALKGKTAIVAPQGVDLSKPYELIYFLHGASGNGPLPTLWVGHGFRKAIQNQLHEMVDKQGRNIIYVTTQLNVADKTNIEDATFGNSESSFVNFHNEVLGIIKEKDSKKGLGATADPQFVNIKAFKQGYTSLAGLMKKMNSPTVGSTKLKRIDMLNASYASGVNSILGTVYGANKGSWKAGEDFEFHIYTSRSTDKETVTDSGVSKLDKKEGCGPPKFDGGEKFNGCKETTLLNGAKTKFEGIYLNLNTGGSATKPLDSYFKTKSLLAKASPGIKEGEFPLKVKKVTVSPAKVPVAYDEEGNAYNHKGEKLPDKDGLKDPNVKCEKGKKKNQRAKTNKPRQLKACEKQCKDSAKGKKTTNAKLVPPGTVECGKNPLGLLDIKAHVKKKNYTAQSSWNKGYQWGNNQVATWIDKVLENPIWGRAEKPSKYGYAYATMKDGRSGIQWIIHDVSPEWANAIDMVRGHVSHREGADFDLNLPTWYKYSTQASNAKNNYRVLSGRGTTTKGGHLQHFESPEKAAKYNGLVVDYDKTIVMGLLTLAMGGKFKNSKILFGEPNGAGGGKPGSSFRKWLKVRIKQIQTQDYDNPKIWMKEPDPAFRQIFKQLEDEGLKGAIGRAIYNMFPMAKNHQNHYHVRVAKKNQTARAGFKRALANLKKKNCDYTGPHSKSPRIWQAWVKADGSGYDLSKTKPKKGWKPGESKT